MKGPLSDKTALIGLALILLLAVFWRWLFLVYPVMDADQAINGLMGRHILLGEFPVFFYGQEYCGSIEAYLVSTVFLLFGASRFTLGAAVGLISLFLVFLVYMLGSRLLGPRPALWAALLTALPSNYFAFHSVLARSAYIESPVLGILLFVLAGRFLFFDDRRPALYFAVGLLAGLGLWTHFLFVFYLVPVGIFLLVREKGFVRQPQVVIHLTLGAVLGGLPLWFYNTIHPLATWQTLQGNAAHESFWTSMKAFFGIRLPELLGLWSSLHQGFYLPYLSAALYGILLAALITVAYLYWRQLRDRRRRKPGFGGDTKLLLVFLLAYPLIFSLSGFAANHTTRYLVPLYPVIPIFLAMLFFHFKKKVPLLAWGLVLALLAANVYGATRMAVVFQPRLVREYLQRKQVDQALFQFLRGRGVRTVYVPDYWRAVPLTFNAREEILFAQPYFDRFPFFTRLVDRASRPAFLLQGDAAVFENTLQALGGTYKKQRLADQWLFYDLEPPLLWFEELDVESQNVGPDGPGAPAAAALDGDLRTRWHLGRPMKPGDVFQLDLGATVPEVARVFLLAGSPEGLPRGLRLEGSVDGRNWTLLRDIPIFWNSLVWSGPHPFIRPERGASELVFTPRPVRFLKITQTGADPDKGWEIAEIRVYRGRPSSPDNIPKLEKVADRLRAWQPDQVLASPWVRAQVDPHWSSWPDDPIRPGPGLFDRNRSTFSFPVLVADPGRSVSLKKALDSLVPGLYRRETLGGWDLYSSRRPSSRFERLDPEGWRVSANINSQEAYRAIDGKTGTRWTSTSPQAPGMRFLVDLERPLPVNRIRLQMGDSYRDFPRRLVVRFSPDGQTWREVVPLNRPLYWDGERVFTDTRGEITDLVFPVMLTRFIALEQTGKDRMYYWSIHELELFSPGPS